MNLNLSPTIRTVLTIVAIVAGSVVTGLGAEGTIPLGVTVALNAFNLVLGYLGVVPPQVGGTQRGVVSPSVHEPPAADVDEAGFIGLSPLFAVLLVIVAFLAILALTHSVLLALVALLLFLLVL